MGLSRKKIKNAKPVDKPYKLAWRWVLSEVCAIGPQTLAKTRNSAIVVAVATLALDSSRLASIGPPACRSYSEDGLACCSAAQTNSQWASV